MKTSPQRSSRKGNAPRRAAFRPKVILVPVDFSDPNEKALGQAVQLAQAYGAALRLVHVLQPPPYPEFGYAYTAARELKLRQQAQKQLEALRSQAPLKDVRKVTAVVRHGRASMEIIAEAKESRADLIVLATHGYTGLFHVMMGSTAEQVVRGAPCPVWTCRTPGTAMV